MTTGAPEDGPLDVVVVGGLTIDRFAHDGLAPGGSVLHATRAAAAAGLVAGVITVAGDEPTARDGVDELRRRARVELQAAAETIRFRHRETASGRRLWLESGGGSIELDPATAERLRTSAFLFAPVAGELYPSVLEGAHERWDPAGWTHGAILQGWLRRANDAREIVPLAPEELDDRLVAALARCAVLVASREDLLAAAEQPARQIRSLRARVGPGPMLVVTDGPEGAWVDDGASPARHLPAPWRVDDVPTVGAGDAFAALFVAALALHPMPSGDQVDRLATEAMRGVAEMLEARRD